MLPQRQERQRREKLETRFLNHSLFALRRADDSHDVIMIDKDQKRMGLFMATSSPGSLASASLIGERAWERGWVDSEVFRSRMYRESNVRVLHREPSHLYRT